METGQGGEELCGVWNYVFLTWVCEGTGLWREDCEFTSYGMMIRIWVGFVGGVDMDEFLARFMFLFHFDLCSLYLHLCYFLCSQS